MTNEKSFCSLGRRVEGKEEEERIFSAVAGTGFLTTLAWSTETGSFLISMPEVKRWKTTSFSGKTCSKTLLPSGLKGCGCMCKPQQVQVADFAWLDPVFGSKAMPHLRGSRQRRHYLELLQVCRQDKLITGNQRRNAREKETQIKYSRAFGSMLQLKTCYYVLRAHYGMDLNVFPAWKMETPFSQGIP